MGRTLRNWTGGWTTVKSVAQEGRKVKQIPPPTPSCFLVSCGTSRTDVTGLKQQKKFFFPFPLNSFFLPSFTFLFLLPAFFYFFILIFVKIPSSYLSSNLFLFLLPSFLSFSIPFSFIPFSFFSLLSPFPTGETIKPGALKRPELDSIRPINDSPRPVSSGD